MNEQKEFPSGIRFTDPHPKAPSFIMGKVSFKVDEFIQYLKEKADNGWVNLILKESQKGAKYFELDTWKPNTTEKYKSPNKVEAEISAQQEMYGDYRPEDNGEERSEIQVDKIPF